MKILIDEHFKSSEVETNKKIYGTLEENRIIYIVDDVQMTFDMDKHILYRKLTDSEYIFDFDKNICIYKDSEYGLNIDLKLEELKCKKGLIFIKYYLISTRDNLIEYQLKYDII